ncbi:kelch-like protein 24 [Saccostrea cucullata]|uniref:kelch-like protein 24 n=1 Tax=Saccostrea cuccullata TaxID=36930 RepID=UPI002ED38132
MMEAQERRKNKTNTIHLLPNIQLQSLKKTESESFVPYTDKGRWPRNLVQGSQTQPQHSSSCDWQAQPRREKQPSGRYQVPPPVPFSYQSNSSYRNEVQSSFQPVERPTTYSESPTGLFNPPPIALSEWNQLYGFPGNTYPPGDGFVRPSAVKKVVENIRKSDTCTFSKTKATSSEVKNDGLKREVNKSPEIRLTLSTNCIYEPDSTLMWRRIFPNCSDTAMDRVLSPSCIKSEEDVASQSPSNHTIVGDQSTTTCDSFAEERFVVLNDNSDIPRSSGSLRAPPHIRSELASSSRSVYNTAPLVSRSSSSEEDNVDIAPQIYNYQIPRPNTSTSKTGGFPERMYASGSYSTSSFESAVGEPMSASTRNSSRASDGRSSGTSSTSQSSPVREGRTSGKSSTLKLSPVCDGHNTGTLSTQSSLYAMDSDSEMRKTSLPIYPNVTQSFQEKVQNEPCQKMQTHFAEIGSYYKKCYDHARIYDVRFLVDNEIIYAHRGALCAVSPYFETIFIENSQIRSKAITEIRIRGLTTRSLKTFLDYAYTGQLKVVSTTILDLVKISTQFKIPYIKEKCIKELETLKFEDLLMLLVAVREDSVHELMIPILRCISRKFLDISICKSFLELDVGTLCVILSYDELVTSSEMDVFSAGLEWINARPNERLQHLETIMKCIRFPLMSQQDLVDCMDRCSLLAANDNCLSMIYKANWIRTVMALNRQDPLNLNMPDSRCLTANEHSNNSTNHINNNATPVNVLDISFGSIESFENYSMYSESFAGSRESFEPSPSQEIDGNFAKERKVYQTLKPELNDNSSMIVLGQKLYVIGGLRYNNDNPLPRRDVWVYSPERGWQKLTSLRTARMHHALCVFDGCIYAIGGLGRNKRILKSVECYNPSTNSWHFVKSLSTPRAGACAAELNGEIFVAGGFGYSLNGNSTILDSVECYQPSTDRWIAKGSLRYGRCHATMTCIENSLYLSGGLAFDKNSSVALSVQDVDLYDANTDSWMLRTYLDKARHSAASFALGKKMYLIGGLSSNQREDLHDDIECWDVQRNAWLSTFKLPTEVQWMKGLA